MECREPIGLKKLILYVNREVILNYPDPDVDFQVDVITHGFGTYEIKNNEYPTWERQIDYSQNFDPEYTDIFRFNLYGIDDNTIQILKDLRTTRQGFIAEAQLKNGRSYVFPREVLVSGTSEKPENRNTWQIEMSYDLPTKEDYKIKLNTLVMNNNYIIFADSVHFGTQFVPEQSVLISN
jgi:hypothetical protein